MDGHRAVADGPRELRPGPRATPAGRVTPEDGAREDGQARPDGAPEVATRDGPERLTAPEVMEVTPEVGQLEAMEVATVDGLPEVETPEDGARAVPVDGNGKNAPFFLKLPLRQYCDLCSKLAISHTAFPV